MYKRTERKELTIPLPLCLPPPLRADVEACLYPLRNKYWREGGGEALLQQLCDEAGYAMQPLAADDGEVTMRGRRVWKLREAKI